MGLWNRKGTVRCDKGTERQRWMVIRCKLKPASTIFSILESSVYTGPWICIMKLQQWMVNCALKILAGNSEDQARYTFNLWVVLNGVMKCHAALPSCLQENPTVGTTFLYVALQPSHLPDCCGIHGFTSGSPEVSHSLNTASQ